MKYRHAYHALSMRLCKQCGWKPAWIVRGRHAFIANSKSHNMNLLTRFVVICRKTAGNKKGRQLRVLVSESLERDLMFMRMPDQEYA